MRVILFFLFLPLFIFSLTISNPSDPKMHLEGIFSKNKVLSIRSGYLYDNIYKGKYEDKLKIPGSSTPSDIQMRISAYELFINVYQRLDLLGIIGTSNLQIDQTIYSDRYPAFGAGLKWLMFSLFVFDFSLDGKFFQTDQKSNYFIIEKQVYYIKNTLIQKVRSYNLSFAFSYPKNFLKPYLGATFLFSEILPNYKVGFFNYLGDEIAFDTSDSINREFFGIVIGISFLNKKNQSSLTLESRMFDENSFSVIGQIRF